MLIIKIMPMIFPIPPSKAYIYLLPPTIILSLYSPSPPFLSIYLSLHPPMCSPSFLYGVPSFLSLFFISHSPSQLLRTWVRVGEAEKLSYGEKLPVVRFTHIRATAWLHHLVSLVHASIVFSLVFLFTNSYLST